MLHPQRGDRDAKTQAALWIGDALSPREGESSV
jgi:hypothetical protein